MGQRREHRGIERTDRQIVSHEDDMLLLTDVAAGRVTVSVDNRMALRQLDREDCLQAGMPGSTPTITGRGRRLIAAWRGETALPLDD